MKAPGKKKHRSPHSDARLAGTVSRCSRHSNLDYFRWLVTLNGEKPPAGVCAGLSIFMENNGAIRQKEDRIMIKLLLVLALLWPVGAAAGLYSGDKLQTFCAATKSGEPKRNLSWYGACVSYLSGLVDAAEWFNNNTTATPRSCFPTGVAPEQLRQVWLNHANQHPEDLQRPAAFIANKAFEEAWPCTR